MSWFRRHRHTEPDDSLAEAKAHVRQLEERSGMIVPRLVGRLDRNHFGESVDQLFRGDR